MRSIGCTGTEVFYFHFITVADISVKICLLAFFSDVKYSPKLSWELEQCEGFHSQVTVGAIKASVIQLDTEKTIFYLDSLWVVTGIGEFSKYSRLLPLS